MCGRYSLTSPLEAMRQTFAIQGLPNLQARYNIAPTQTAPVIRQHPDGRLLMHDIQWGLIPSWAKDATGGARLINARAETVAEKPSFRAALGRRRCLVPADGFYEWRKPEPKVREPWRITLQDQQLFAFAGLWERWQGTDGVKIDSYTIITTDAAPAIADIHHRMPVILKDADHARWLDPGTATDDLQELLRPNTGVRGYRVSPRVGKVQNDDPDLIAEIDAD
ncbi:MAG: SOS response-associated peptidase [Minwuia sp.]|nr:SOS response-associated peptidase [Minwuia sp.]